LWVCATTVVGRWVVDRSARSTQQDISITRAPYDLLVPNEEEPGRLFGDDEDAEFYRWYGAWQPLSPTEVAQMMAGVEVQWWVIGGWAVDAFTRRTREHEDIDVAIFADDLPQVWAHLSPNYCLWSNVNGTIRPLRRPDDLLEGCHQVWVRRDGDTPWLADLALHPRAGDDWRSRRDARVRLPLDEAIYVADDGIRYLRPEIVLLMKARICRPKDERDLAAILPLLEPDRRAWLRRMLELTHPGHQWLERVWGDSRVGGDS
jgi:hypothetical protein